MDIKFLVMDVDGTLTDGRIYIGNDGEVCKAFNVKDGLGIASIAIPNGIEPVILTGRTSRIVENRCRELGIDKIYQGVSDKTEMILNIFQDLSKVAYIGDDLNDLLPMKSVKEAGGFVGCPNDAACEVKDIADYISGHDGGCGAVRDFIEWLLR